MFRASGLSPISPVSLDGSKDIQYVKSKWSVLHSQLEARILPPLEGNNNKGREMDNHIHDVEHLSQNAVKHGNKWRYWWVNVVKMNYLTKTLRMAS